MSVLVGQNQNKTNPPKKICLKNEYNRNEKWRIYHVLFHVGADDAATSHLDLDGLCQDPTSQRLHGSGEGGRKHDCLTVGPHVVHNTHHLVEKPQHFTVHSIRKQQQ